jgi:gliding motility-associated-like protein
MRKSFLIILAFALSLIGHAQQMLELCDEDTSEVFSYTTNAGVPGTYYWQVDGGPVVIDGPTYDIVWGNYGEGTHTITVGFDDGIGCPAEPVNLTVNVEICVKSTMWAPNCFTPDGDENNNIWQPIGTNYRDPYFFIMNRWGNTVFESYDLSYGWDGSYRGKMCQDGVYIFVLRWKDPDNRRYEKHGHITLLR